MSQFFEPREKEPPLVDEAIKLICQLYKVTTTKDGGSRIVLDCGSESLKAVQRIQTLSSLGDVSLAIACVPYNVP